jgi:hypothetical protein
MSDVPDTGIITLGELREFEEFIDEEWSYWIEKADSDRIKILGNWSNHFFVQVDEWEKYHENKEPIQKLKFFTPFEFSSLPYTELELIVQNHPSHREEALTFYKKYHEMLLKVANDPECIEAMKKYDHLKIVVDQALLIIRENLKAFE